MALIIRRQVGRRLALILPANLNEVKTDTSHAKYLFSDVKAKNYWIGPAQRLPDRPLVKPPTRRGDSKVMNKADILRKRRRRPDTTLFSREILTQALEPRILP